MLIIAAVVVGLFAAPAAADRTITIGGDRSGYALVDFPLPVTAETIEKSLSIQGEGRMFGVLIRPDSDELLSYPIQGALRSNDGVFCGRTCASEPARLLHMAWFLDNAGGGIAEFYEPGRYRVHLVVDEQPVRASFKITAPDSAVVALAPDVPTHAESQEPDMIGLPGGEYGGSNGALRTGGLVWIADYSESEATWLAGQWEHCAYSRHQDPDAYFPGCGGEDLFFGFTANSGPGTGSGLGWSVAMADPGDYGLGGNVLLAGTLNPLINVRVAWVDFFPRAAVAAPAAQPTPASPPPAPAPPPPATTHSTGAPRSTLAIMRIGTTRKGRVLVRVRCTGRSRCTGRVRAIGGHATRVTLASGAARTVTVRVPRGACRVELRTGGRRTTRPLPGRRCR